MPEPTLTTPAFTTTPDINVFTPERFRDLDPTPAVAQNLRAIDLFSLFTATIINAEVIFIR